MKNNYDSSFGVKTQQELLSRRRFSFSLLSRSPVRGISTHSTGDLVTKEKDCGTSRLVPQKPRYDIVRLLLTHWWPTFQSLYAPRVREYVVRWNKLLVTYLTCRFGRPATFISFTQQNNFPPTIILLYTIGYFVSRNRGETVLEVQLYLCLSYGSGGCLSAPACTRL